MSLPQETLLELMALADGELDGEDRDRLERLVASSDEARRVVTAMRSPAIGDWLRADLDDRAGAADDIADAVMGKLEATSPVAAGQVASLADARARRASRAQILGASIGAALALAAGIALFLRAGAGTGEPQAPVASVVLPPVDVLPNPSSLAALAQRPSQGVEVDEVDSPSRDISVFEIPLGTGAANAAGPSSVVIMIEDDPGPK